MLSLVIAKSQITVDIREFNINNVIVLSYLYIKLESDQLSFGEAYVGIYFKSGNT